MTLSDLNGRPYARREAVKPGDFLVADGGFTCMSEGERKQVRADKKGHGFERLFIVCDWNEDGTRHRHRHYLAGQDEGDGGLIGLYPADV